MDMQAILAEVATWPVERRRQLADRIREGLDDGEEQGLTAEVRELLDARLARHEASPDDVLTWDEVVAHVRRPR